MSSPQSAHESGTTLNIFPPNVTMRYWPTTISTAMSQKAFMPAKWNAERPVMKARALNMFQNWRNTKMVNMRLSS